MIYLRHIGHYRDAIIVTIIAAEKWLTLSGDASLDNAGGHLGIRVTLTR
jgi:hypothetical protein